MAIATRTPDRSRPHDDGVPDCQDIPWRCARCTRLLGFVDRATKSVLRLKYKDAFVWVYEPKKVATPCRGCGAYCELDNVSEAEGR